MGFQQPHSQNRLIVLILSIHSKASKIGTLSGDRYNPRDFAESPIFSGIECDLLDNFVSSMHGSGRVFKFIRATFFKPNCTICDLQIARPKSHYGEPLSGLFMAENWPHMKT